MQSFSRLILVLGSYLVVAFAFSGSSLLSGCANPAQPMGGPRDSMPPILLKSLPADSTTGFTAKKIELQFDEYIQLDNPFENVLVNPPLNRFPTIDGKLRSVIIQIKDTLQPNTTYSIDFGKAIKDVNEGNPLKGYTYVFSTGSYLDSLELTGKLQNAETGQPDSTLIIILHTSTDDSAVAKEKPVYITRPNGKGEFNFRHLPAKEFRVFALKDEGFKQYQNNSTPFAFADSSVIAGQQTAPLLLRFFTIPDSTETNKPATVKTANTRIGQRKGTDEEESDNKKLNYTVSARGKPQDILNPLVINFPYVVAGIDTNKIILSDTLFQPMAPGNFLIDSTSIQMPVNWKSSTPYILLLEKGFATDSAGLTTLRNDTIRFTTRSESEYGAVRMQFNGIDMAKKPVLYWIQNNTLVKKSVLSSNNLRIQLLEPGQYTLRIIYDENGNGEWDTGDYWKRRQPELVLPFPKEISIRANWDNEFTFDL